MKAVLVELDRLAEEHGLDCGEPCEPVTLRVLIEEFFLGFSLLPEEILAISVHWRGRAGIRLNSDLREPTRSRDKRHAEGHEFGHIHRRHNGHFILWQADWSNSTELEKWLAHKVEREAELIAAYLLVRRRALDAMQECESGYIARVLDVPEHLVRLRYEILENYGR